MNIYRDVQSLQRSPVETGGLCSVVYFRIEDVLTWPAINHETGIMDTAIVMKPGKYMYLCEAADKGRSFEEELKYNSAGPYSDIQVAGILRGGHNTANILTLDAMKHHQWGVIVQDRAGFYRLIGGPDRGARLTYKYNSGDVANSRRVEVKWSWLSPNAAVIYNSALFTITIGTVTVIAGKLTLIMRFEVGAPGAPMGPADTTLTNAGFANKNLLVLANGIALPVDDGTGAINWGPLIVRHIEKELAEDTTTWIGGVVNQEIIEIYAFE